MGKKIYIIQWNICLWQVETSAAEKEIEFNLKKPAQIEMVEIEEEPGTQFEMKDSEIMPILSKPPFAKPDDYEDGVD